MCWDWEVQKSDGFSIPQFFLALQYHYVLCHWNNGYPMSPIHFEGYNSPHYVIFRTLLTLHLFQEIK